MAHRSNAFGKITFLALACIALCLTVRGARTPQTHLATAEIPKTAPGEQFSAWLAAFNSGERAHLETFRSHYAKPEEHKVDGILAFRQQTGGFDLKKIEDSTATQLTGLVEERGSDQFAHFTIEVEAAAPYKVIRLELRGVDRPAEFPLAHLSQGELIGALRTKLEKDASTDKFAGTVLLAKDGKAIFTGAYGMADREQKIPNTLSTKLRIGSMNKRFTAVSILQLVQAGKIALNDPVGKYLTDYPNKEIATKVTMITSTKTSISPQA